MLVVTSTSYRVQNEKRSARLCEHDAAALKNLTEIRVQLACSGGMSTLDLSGTQLILLWVLYVWLLTVMGVNHLRQSTLIVLIYQNDAQPSDFFHQKFCPRWKVFDYCNPRVFEKADEGVCDRHFAGIR